MNDDQKICEGHIKHTPGFPQEVTKNGSIKEIYKTIFENTGTSIILIEEDMTISMANSEFLRNSGLTLDGEHGLTNWSDLVHPDDRQRLIEQHRLRLQDPDRALKNYEFRYMTKEGQQRHALATVQLVPGTKKTVASLIDITDRRQAEAQLMNSEEKFRTLAESSPLAIMMHQGDHWIYANRAAKKISGYTETELCSMHFWDIVHPEYRDQIKEIGRNRQKGKIVPDSYEFIIITKSGEEKWVSLTGNRIEYEEQPTALICVADISDRKHSEFEKSKLEDQLQQAQKLESVGRLAGGVAHDFNNMLGVILGQTELALLKIDPDHPMYSNIREIRKAAERSADLTRQLLAFARKQTVSPIVLDLNETVTGMLQMLRRLIGEDIHLKWEPEEGLWPVKMDPSQIDQILANLCVNARDAISGVGTMTIEAENITFSEDHTGSQPGFRAGEYVRISVSDDGCGMDKETLSYMFEPFYTTKGVSEGTGLGLSTVYGAVKQNKGFINAYSELGRGTTISIYLPRYEGQAGQICKKSPSETTPQGKETILLVEDEPAILEVVTEILLMQGYTVLDASTPGEAVRIATEHAGEINLLLTDVVMPEMNGRDLAKTVQPLYPNIKHLFMSGYTANVIANQGILDEGVHFIQKPFSAKDLAVKVREALDNH